MKSILPDLLAALNLPPDIRCTVDGECRFLECPHARVLPVGEERCCALALVPNTVTRS